MSTHTLHDICRRLLREIDEEIEQRKTGGNAEHWADLQRLSDEAHAALSRATGETTEITRAEGREGVGETLGRVRQIVGFFSPGDRGYTAAEDASRETDIKSARLPGAIS